MSTELMVPSDFLDTLLLQYVPDATDREIITHHSPRTVDFLRSEVIFRYVQRFLVPTALSTVGSVYRQVGSTHLELDTLLGTYLFTASFVRQSMNEEEDGPPTQVTFQWKLCAVYENDKQKLTWCLIEG